MIEYYLSLKPGIVHISMMTETVCSVCLVLQANGKTTLKIFKYLVCYKQIIFRENK